jgi:RES domain-containing protein
MAAAGPSSWDATAAVSACPIVSWSGEVWRCHSRRYAGDDAAGSLKATGRYNRGGDKYPVPETWPALYTALGQHIALGERLRHTTPAALSRLSEQRISRLTVRLQTVLDCCAAPDCVEPVVSGLVHADICRRSDYRMTHALAQAARRRGVEGLLIPSCTKFRGGNLIVFPDLLLPGSTVELIDSEDPDLFVDWGSLS